MSVDQPASLCGEPLNFGISMATTISSVAGSSSLFFTQPLITGHVFESAAVLIGSELFLFIARHLFRLESIPVLDVTKGQTVKMPLNELQEFLRWVANGSDGEYTRTTDSGTTTSGTSTSRGFPSVETPEAPLIVFLYVSADYSNKPFTPSVWFLFPILTFPGLRGALPLLMVELLATIFVRAVVPPESTGSKPLSNVRIKKNNPLTFTPSDISKLLNKFRKQEGSK